MISWQSGSLSCLSVQRMSGNGTRVILIGMSAKEAGMVERTAATVRAAMVG